MKKISLFLITLISISFSVSSQGNWSSTTTDNVSEGRLVLGGNETEENKGDVISLFGNRLGGTNMYGFGLTDGQLYYKSPTAHRWLINMNGGSLSIPAMHLTNERLLLNTMLDINNGDNSYGAILANATRAGFALYTKSLYTSDLYSESFRLGLKYEDDQNNGFISFYRGGNTRGGFLGFSTDGVERMKISAKGDVGIGVVPDEEFRLSVNGAIRTKEVKVDALNWPDFVFLNDYKLSTLAEVEAHINEKGHLQGVPSAKEVEENGILVGEMNSKLLQKIEELTLYTIQQQKEITELKKQNESIESIKAELMDIRKELKKIDSKK